MVVERTLTSFYAKWDRNLDTRHVDIATFNHDNRFFEGHPKVIDLVH